MPCRGYNSGQTVGGVQGDKLAMWRSGAQYERKRGEIWECMPQSLVDERERDNIHRWVPEKDYDVEIKY